MYTNLVKNNETVNYIKTDRLSGHNFSGAAPRVSKDNETPMYRGAIKCVRTADWSNTVIVRNNWRVTKLDPREYYNEDGMLNVETVVAYFRRNPMYAEISMQKATEIWLCNFNTAVYVTDEMADAKEARRLADVAVAEAGL